MNNKILVIDDDEVFGESVREIFQCSGYEIETAHSGQEGLRKARIEKFDLMIVDMKMPDITGLELIKKIKEEQPETMMIMITGYATVETATEALKTGAFDYITKPFNPEAISSASLTKPPVAARISLSSTSEAYPASSATLRNCCAVSSSWAPSFVKSQACLAA